MLSISEKDRKEILEIYKKALRSNTYISKLIKCIVTRIENPDIRDAENIEKDIDRLLSLMERYYLSSKRIAATAEFFKTKEGEESVDDKDIIFPYPNFPVSFKKCSHADEYIFILPMLESKNYNHRVASDGKIIEKLMKRLLNEYEENEGMLKMYQEPVAGVFIHHIKKDNLAKAIDADNIDIKKVIDALQGYLIADDNLMCFTPLHLPVLEERNYCELHILPYADLPEWLLKNKKTLNF